MLTAEDGYKIATKVGATPVEKRKHVRVTVTVRGQLVGSYGIQRGSKELPHDYIAQQIGITQREARDLSLCPLSLSEYIALLEQRGKLSPPEQEARKNQLRKPQKKKKAT
jgi:hypothetical protein